MSDALVKAFITPMEREDMGVLSNQLDAVTDHVEGVLHRLYFDNILEIRPDALQMVDTVVRGCKEMRALMDELPQFKKSKTLQDVYKRQTHKVHRIIPHREPLDQPTCGTINRIPHRPKCEYNVERTKSPAKGVNRERHRHDQTRPRGLQGSGSRLP